MEQNGFHDVEEMVWIQAEHRWKFSCVRLCVTLAAIKIYAEHALENATFSYISRYSSATACRRWGTAIQKIFGYCGVEFSEDTDCVKYRLIFDRAIGKRWRFGTLDCLRFHNWRVNFKQFCRL